MSPIDRLRPSPDAFKDEAYEKAVRDFPVGSWVYLTVTKQLGVVNEVRATPDGPSLRVHAIGTVPVRELRLATEEEIRRWQEIH